MKLTKYLRRQLFTFAIFALVLTTIGPTPAPSVAVADELEGVYTKTFTISAYYSPLPCQEKYTTGSYKGDIRLNGNGTNGADGTPVYPGMVAAPSSYSFGTKLFIPGVGTVAVHDRGGAIVENDGENGVYDRLDIWMGYGDIGLQRALNWGKRNVDVTVYGVNAAIAEEIMLSNYSESEAVPQECVAYEEEREPEIYDATDHVEAVPEVAPEPELDVELSDKMSTTLQFGDQSSAVISLQTELNHLNYYKGEINGAYDDLTMHAVYKFQQSQGLVADSTSLGAGVFGPKTKDTLNEIITNRNYTTVLVATTTMEKTGAPVMVAEEPVVVESEVLIVEEPEDKVIAQKYLVNEMDYGLVSPEVIKLQQFLAEHGYFPGALTTEYFGAQTQEALLTFQIDEQIIASVGDHGAGRVGPTTLATINSYF
jgi:peptidoglycan hydrolase-like protein with peptidoglycan-binding domain/3D (Asp-Asp-Asp) domain-containing protein